MAHTDHGGPGHGEHHDVSGDKSAAFMGLFAGLVLIGSFLFGMVKWTNHHLNADEPRANATATK